jgi:hypothetical protein
MNSYFFEEAIQKEIVQAQRALSRSNKVSRRETLIRLELLAKILPDFFKKKAGKQKKIMKKMGIYRKTLALSFGQVRTFLGPIFR